jgi:hypothetical protein
VVQSQPRKIVRETLSQKKINPSQKRTGGVAQDGGTESNPSTAKKKKKKKRKERKGGGEGGGIN